MWKLPLELIVQIAGHLAFPDNRPLLLIHPAITVTIQDSVYRRLHPGLLSYEPDLKVSRLAWQLPERFTAPDRRILYGANSSWIAWSWARVAIGPTLAAIYVLFSNRPPDEGLSSTGSNGGKKGAGWQILLTMVSDLWSADPIPAPLTCRE